MACRVRGARRQNVTRNAGELLVDDGGKPGVWDAVVVDIETGFARDFYTRTVMGRIARVSVA
jgi:hypothetical protein